MKTVALESILAKIQPVTESGCWIWMGEIASSHGYGIINGNLLVGKRRDYAHRELYRRYKGNIPTGFTIDHLCRVRCCVNPNHLEAVTIGENIRRGAKIRKRTHCPNDHLLSDDNLYKCSTRPGMQICKICALAKAKRRDRRGMSKMQRIRISTI